MKIYSSEFKGHQVYNPTANFVSVGFDTGLITHKPQVTREEWQEYISAIQKYSSYTKTELFLIAHREAVAPFTRIEKYNGLKKQLEGCLANADICNDIYTCNALNKHFMYSGCSITDENTESAFSVSNRIIWFGTKTVFDDIVNNISNYDDPTAIKNELLNRDCVLVELLDLGIDGNTMFFMSSPNAMQKIKELFPLSNI